MEEDIESLVGELKVIADGTQDPFDKKRLKQIAEAIEKKNQNTKCSTNMLDPINIDSIFGEVNMIGNQLELWGLDYSHMYTNIWRLGLRLQELYQQYILYKRGD